MSRRFDNFSSRLAGETPPSAPAAAPETSEPETPQAKEPKGSPAPESKTEPEEENSMADETPVEQTDAYQAGVNAERERVSAVFASEHFAGREAFTPKLLGKGLSAEDTIDLLADMPKAAPVSQDEANKAAEAAAREEMREEMAKAGNADLGASKDNDGKTGRAKADAVWDKANATVGRVKKEG